MVLYYEQDEQSIIKSIILSLVSVGSIKRDKTFTDKCAFSLTKCVFLTGSEYWQAYIAINADS